MKRHAIAIGSVGERMRRRSIHDSGRDRRVRLDGDDGYVLVRRANLEHGDDRGEADHRRNN